MGSLSISSLSLSYISLSLSLSLPLSLSFFLSLYIFLFFDRGRLRIATPLIFDIIFKSCSDYHEFKSRVISLQPHSDFYGPWDKHVLSYWKLRNEENVLFLKYEDMKKVRNILYPIMINFLYIARIMSSLTKII